MHGTGFRKILPSRNGPTDPVTRSFAGRTLERINFEWAYPGIDHPKQPSKWKNSERTWPFRYQPYRTCPFHPFRSEVPLACVRCDEVEPIVILHAVFATDISNSRYPRIDSCFEPRTELSRPTKGASEITILRMAWFSSTDDRVSDQVAGFRFAKRAHAIATQNVARFFPTTGTHGSNSARNESRLFRPSFVENDRHLCSFRFAKRAHVVASHPITPIRIVARRLPRIPQELSTAKPEELRSERLVAPPHPVSQNVRTCMECRHLRKMFHVS